MVVQIKFASLKGIQPHEWLIRFVFGGAICVIAGVVSSHYGPAIGGLLLAFPAIFPAGASLVEAHERKHKARVGLDGAQRGRMVAGVEAIGASIGCIALACFAVFCWLWFPHMPTWVVLLGATMIWLLVAAILWWIRKGRLLRNLHRRRTIHAFRPS